MNLWNDEVVCWGFLSVLSSGKYFVSAYGDVMSVISDAQFNNFIWILYIRYT